MLPDTKLGCLLRGIPPALLFALLVTVSQTNGHVTASCRGFSSLAQVLGDRTTLLRVPGNQHKTLQDQLLGTKEISLAPQGQKARIKRQREEKWEDGEGESNG